MKNNIHIGTSGWQYRHWVNNFYPATLKTAQYFEYYAGQLDTVELNNSFYRLPSFTNFTNWRKASPGNFIFSVKAPRFFTHMKKLNVDRQSVKSFIARASRLGNHLGPILFQLPPKWKKNCDRLKRFLTLLPPGRQYTFEFRDQSWYDSEVYSLLKKFNCAFCIYHLDYHQSPKEITADFVYVRMHGPANKYQGSYNPAILKNWAATCIKWSSSLKDVFIYFDNDQDGHAVQNAITLQKMVALSRR